MEKICQNIIENEFRFMTPINYVCQPAREKEKNEKGRRVYFPSDIHIPFSYAPFYRPSTLSLLNCLLQFHGNLSTMRNIAKFFMILLSRMYVWYSSIYRRHVLRLFSSSFGNVACNDGTFVGLLISHIVS